MSERTETFAIEGRPSVAINLHSAEIRFRSGEAGFVTIALDGNADVLEQIEIDASDDAVTVRSMAKKRRWFSGGSIEVVVTLPHGSDVLVRLGTGDVSVDVDVNDLEISTGSGDMRVNDVLGTADLNVGSGDIRVASVASSARVKSATGDVRLERVSDVTVSSAAGDTHLGEVTEVARIKSAAGDVRVRRFTGTDLDIKTMSGDATIGLVPGLIINAQIKTMSGELRNRIEPSNVEKTKRVNLAVTSFAGDVTLKSA